MVYTVIGLLGSFLMSLLFYLLSCFKSFIFIDVVTDYAKGQKLEEDSHISGNQLYDSVLVYRNIGIKTASIESYAKKDCPKVLQCVEGTDRPFGRYRVIPPGKLNINDISLTRKGDDLYINYSNFPLLQVGSLSILFLFVF